MLRTTAFCRKCGREVGTTSPGQAAVIAGVSMRDIYGMIEADRVHVVESGDGSLDICAASLEEKGG